MSSVKQSSEKALKMLRSLPRVSLGNIRDNPNSKQKVSTIKLCIKHSSINFDIIIFFFEFIIVE